MTIPASVPKSFVYNTPASGAEHLSVEKDPNIFDITVIKTSTAPENAAAATATITYDTGTNVTANKVVVVGGITYKFVAAVAAAYDVKIGADADASMTNLSRAINKSGGTPGAGNDYIATVANPLVTSTISTGSNVVTLTSKIKGVIGNAYTITTTEPTATVSDFETEATGVDGTVGVEGEIFWDHAAIYVCTADNTIADANWKKATLVTVT